MDEYNKIHSSLLLLLQSVELKTKEDQSNIKYKIINNLRLSIINLLADMSLAEKYYKQYIDEKQM